MVENFFVVYLLFLAVVGRHETLVNCCFKNTFDLLRTSMIPGQMPGPCNYD